MDELKAWSSENQMKFTAVWYKVMHLETNKLQACVWEMTGEAKVLKLKSSVGKRTNEHKAIINTIKFGNWKDIFTC